MSKVYKYLLLFILLLVAYFGFVLYSDKNNEIQITGSESEEAFEENRIEGSSEFSGFSDLKELQTLNVPVPSKISLAFENKVPITEALIDLSIEQG